MPRSIPGHGCFEHQEAAGGRRAPACPPRSHDRRRRCRGTGSVAEPGLVGDRARQRRDHDPARLRLPPGVDDRTALAADHAVVPHPGLGIDRLADRAEQAQRREIVLLRVLVAEPHEGADRRRRGVEDRDAVALDDVPEAVGPRVRRRALVHQRGRAVREDPVDDVGVARHPAAVGRAPVGVVVLEVEDRLRGGRDVGEVAARGVQDALRLAGRAAGVEHEERVLGVERGGLAVGALARDQRRATRGRGPRRNRRRLAGAPHHHHVLDAGVSPRSASSTAGFSA